MARKVSSRLKVEFWSILLRTNTVKMFPATPNTPTTRMATPFYSTNHVYSLFIQIVKSLVFLASLCAKKNSISWDIAICNWIIICLKWAFSSPGRLEPAHVLYIEVECQLLWTQKIRPLSLQKLFESFKICTHIISQHLGDKIPLLWIRLILIHSKGISSHGLGVSCGYSL